MGSGGSGGTYFPSPEKMRSLIERAKEQVEQDRLDGEVNELLQRYLVRFNERDADKIREYLDDLHNILGSKVEVDQLLMGGSVAKHTYVDGLSDVDALVILDRDDLRDKSPQDVLKEFHRILRDQMTHDVIESITAGTLAVTVTYRDGTEIQMLPSMRRGDKVAISDQSGKNWRTIDPKAFQSELTDANQRLGHALVPAIKLAKAINSNLPPQRQLSGVHLETLAVEIFRGYQGPRTPKAMLIHFFEAASTRVRTPIRDVTGQSSAVDEDLGDAGSTARRLASDTLATIARRLRAASSVEQWRKVIEV